MFAGFAIVATAVALACRCGRGRSRSSSSSRSRCRWSCSSSPSIELAPDRQRVEVFGFDRKLPEWPRRPHRRRRVARGLAVLASRPGPLNCHWSHRLVAGLVGLANCGRGSLADRRRRRPARRNRLAESRAEDRPRGDARLIDGGRGATTASGRASGLAATIAGDGDHGDPDPDHRSGQRCPSLRRLPQVIEGHLADQLLDTVSTELPAPWTDTAAINPGPFQFHSDEACVRRWMAARATSSAARGGPRDHATDPGRRRRWLQRQWGLCDGIHRDDHELIPA